MGAYVGTLVRMRMPVRMSAADVYTAPQTGDAGLLLMCIAPQTGDAGHLPTLLILTWLCVNDHTAWNELVHASTASTV